ncbi:hypothetical protein [Botrimarina colliarenosi]|nr:hypothetical protein [Botrimarina colliarenosi]
MPAKAAEDYSETPYYEEEPWYDITEWFDGNDYRRTAANDTSEADSDATVTDYEYDYGYHYDVDGDLDYGGHYEDQYGDTQYGYESDYGYDDRYANDDWFYDYWYWNKGPSYYNDWDADGSYEYVTTYKDYDNDGYYDAYFTYRDWNSDGIYEDVDFYSFNNASGDKRSEGKEQGESMQSKARRTQGTVANVKKVKVRGNEHLLVRLDGGEDKQSTVDLGPTEALQDFDIAEGTEVQATGPVVKVGDKRLLVAKSAKISGQTFKPNRNNSKVRGTIVSTRKFENRGATSLLATVKTEEGSSEEGAKLLVDLGPADKLATEFSEDDQVTVEGAPVKVNDKRILIASRVKHDGETTEIDRRTGVQRADSQQASRNQRQKDSQTAMKSPTFSGKVASKRRATVRGEERQLMVLRTDTGRQVLVDLGPAEQLDMTCEPGDQCKVRGPVVKARGGQPVVLCRMLVINDGNRTRVRPQQADSNGLSEVTGDIRSLTTVEVQGTERQHAYLNTEDGKKLIVDLGAPDKLPLELSKGEQLSARGRIVKVNDKVILVAFEASKSDSDSQSIER